jgi:hypothetical protein
MVKAEAGFDKPLAIGFFEQGYSCKDSENLVHLVSENININQFVQKLTFHWTNKVTETKTSKFGMNCQKGNVTKFPMMAHF